MVFQRIGLLAKKTTVPRVHPLTLCQYLERASSAGMYWYLKGNRRADRTQMRKRNVCLPSPESATLRLEARPGVLRSPSYHGRPNLQLKISVTHLESTIRGSV